MPAKPTAKVDLAKLFKTVATTMASNREQLNQADAQNHDHGDNMVEVFNLISQTMRSQRRAAPAEQLMQASRVLSGTQSGSEGMRVYNGLRPVPGQVLTPENARAGQLLMGASQQEVPPLLPDRAAGRPLGLCGQPSLNAPAAASRPTASAGAAPTGLDLGSLLNAGMAFMNAKQGGGSDLSSLAQALSAGRR
jgi:hypothetical protein